MGPPTSGSWAALRVLTTLTLARDRIWLTVFTAVVATSPPSDILVTLTRASSAPMPRNPDLPLLSISTSTSLRSTPSSFRASSSASSTVRAVLMTASILHYLLGSSFLAG